MINNQYQLYTDKVLSLAETIVVKFDDAATALNLQVQMNYGPSAVDPLDPYSWKYYQNISGQYHATDTVIQISSLDTNTKIDFTPANLAIHTATKAAYVYASRFYRELVAQYPDQVLLILGVIYPCDITQAVNAVDGTILGYPSFLVDFNEYTFIIKLQAWIYAYLDRWVNRPFSLSDDLYTATYLGQFYLHLVQAIFSIRLQACKTNEVHSFHVQQYLASNGMLDIYLNTLTLAQALWLYRNILYLQRHVGKRDTFDWLLEHLLTQRNLPVYAYSMSHDVSAMARVTASDDTGLLPSIAFKRKPLNQPATAVEVMTYTLPEVLTKTAPLAIGNPEYQATHALDIQQQLTYAPSATVTTKVLESSVVDYTDAVAYPLGAILLNQWLYWVSTGQYSATVILDIPQNGTSIRLQAQDAVALFAYAISASGTPATETILATIPSFQLNRVALSPVPNKTSLHAVVNPAYITQAEIDAIYATRVIATDYPSIDAFYAACLQVYTAANYQYELYCRKENQISRGQAQAAVAQLYGDAVVSLQATGSNYAGWLTTLGLDFSGYTPEDFYKLSVSIAEAATGSKTHVRSNLPAVQQAMVRIFTQLSSYSIQMVADINLSPIVKVANPALRLGDAGITEHSTGYVDGASCRVSEAASRESATFNVDINQFVPLEPPTFSEQFKGQVLLTPHLTAASGVALANVINLNTDARFTTTLGFAEMASQMTIAQRNALRDTYCDCDLSTTQEIAVDLNGFLLISNTVELEGFTFIGRNFTPVLEGPVLEQTLPGFTYSGVNIVRNFN